MQPFLAHIKRLEDRLSIEVSKLTKLKEDLVEAKRKVREEYDSKVAELESKVKDEKEKLTKENEEELQKMDRQHQDVAEILAKNFVEILGLRDQWLSLMQGVGEKYIAQEDSDSGYESFPELPLLAPAWLYEDVNDTNSIVDGEEIHEESRDSDKIPVEGNVFEVLADEKIPCNPINNGKEGFVAHEVHGSPV